MWSEGQGEVMLYRDGHVALRVATDLPVVLRHVDGRCFLGIVEAVRPPLVDVSFVPAWAPRTLQLGAVLAAGRLPVTRRRLHESRLADV